MNDDQSPTTPLPQGPPQYPAGYPHPGTPAHPAAGRPSGDQRPQGGQPTPAPHGGPEHTAIGGFGYGQQGPHGAGDPQRPQYPHPQQHGGGVPPHQPGFGTSGSSGSGQPKRRTGRIIGTAVLVGALAGGAAGFGASALVDNDTNAASSDGLVRADTSNGKGDSADNASAISGTTQAAAEKALPSVVKIYATGQQGSGSGSGIILTDDGQILTNNHVVEGAAEGGELAVSFNDGSTAAATIVGRDPLTDLAVIQAEDVSGLTPATLGDSDDLAVGQQVVAVGSPFGLEATVTTGIVSALNRPVTTQAASATDPATIFPAIQTDAAINPGNSGGPLIDLDGNVVGIDSAIRTASDSSGQGGSIGLGFAIPINDAIPIVEQLRDGETATHARIGVSVEDASDQVGLPDGALISAVDPGTAGEDAGLQTGDVITKVDDQLITNADSLVATVRSYRPGDTVTLTVTSSQNGQSTGDEHTVDVELGSD